MKTQNTHGEKRYSDEHGRDTAMKQTGDFCFLTPEILGRFVDTYFNHDTTQMEGLGVSNSGNYLVVFKLFENGAYKEVKEYKGQFKHWPHPQKMGELWLLDFKIIYLSGDEALCLQEHQILGSVVCPPEPLFHSIDR